MFCEELRHLVEKYGVGNGVNVHPAQPGDIGIVEIKAFFIGKNGRDGRIQN